MKNASSMISRHLTLVVHGIDKAQFVAGLLSVDSRWYEFTPLPDDYYEYRVKNEARDRLPYSHQWKERKTQ